MNPTEPGPASWLLPDQSEVAARVRKITADNLQVYQIAPLFLEEHKQEEVGIVAGAYFSRQVFELVQNAADAIMESGCPGRIEMVLTNEALYCANEGFPLSPEGAESLLMNRISRKGGAEIGHFGVGFKSVLAVTDNPQFYSRSGSLVFSAAESRARIRAVTPNDEYAPVLRLATPADPVAAASADRLLSGLMTWASTVVKLPLVESARESLSTDLAEFPVEFVLFCPHVSELRLEDQRTGNSRSLSLHHGRAGELFLHDGQGESTWRLFSTTHEPASEAARIQADRRQELPLAWAVPVLGRTGRGKFWAFFPLHDETTLRGILNAGWATTSDRHNLVVGPLNDELIKAAANLVAANLPTLIERGDPGRVLDLLPADSNSGEHDHKLANALFAELARIPSLPDGNGLPRVPRTLHLHPGNVPETALRIWSECPCRPQGWAHWTTNSQSRRSRARRMGAVDGERVETWLTSLVVDSTVEGSRAAILAAAAVIGEDRSRVLADDVCHAQIVMTRAGRLVPPAKGAVYLPSMPGTESLGFPLVCEALQKDPDVVAALLVLGVTKLDGAEALGAITKNGHEECWGIDWLRFWEVSRFVDREVLIDFLKKRMSSKGAPSSTICVRNRAGEFVSLSRVLIPGGAIGIEDDDNRSCCLDMQFHQPDIDALRAIGIVDTPRPGGCLSFDAVVCDHAVNKTQEFRQFCELETGTLPQHNSVVITRFPVSGPLEVIEKLPEAARAKYCTLLIPHCHRDQRWVFHYSTSGQFKRTADMTYDSPALEHVRRHGWLPTSLGDRPASECVGQSLHQWRQLLPVASLSGDDCRLLSLPESLQDLSASIWESGLARAALFEDEEVAWRFYSAAARFPNGTNSMPAQVLCRVGSSSGARRTTEVHVTSDLEELRRHMAADEPAMLVEDAVCELALAKAWRMRRPIITTKRRIGFRQSGAEETLQDRLPRLEALAPERARGFLLVPCSEVWVELSTPTGTSVSQSAVELEGNQVFYLDTLDEQSLLRSLVDLLGLDLAASMVGTLLRQPASEAGGTLAEKVRGCEDLAGKLLAAVGTEALRQSLPKHVLKALGPDATSTALCRVFLALHSSDSLKVVEGELRARGFRPPYRWSGGSRSLAFVRDLGFPDEYAGLQPPHKEAWFEVDGPPQIPALHDFQEAVSRALKCFLEEELPGRAMLSLPTGSGKTRVVAQTFIQAYRESALEGTVLWIADREELCEQAVQCWQELWRALGPDQTLRISRLWGGTRGEIYAVGARPHLVVATYQTLKNRLKVEWNWLSDPACIVVDEAHGSTAPSFTQIFDWLGLDHRTTARPLLGVTATPYRGTAADDEETRRLVNRYGGRRLDHGVFEGDDPYPLLQGRGVLSFVDHEVLDGTEVQLGPGELAHLDQYGVLHPDAELRLGRDRVRNDRILAAVKDMPLDWSVLLFAASVEHAELLAAMLTLGGVSARAISGRTDSSTRWHSVESFRRRDVRALCNYKVLSTGFDAPETRAVVITRPVFSPGLYQQMIGRGLRGPKNGGTQRCLIVDVADNIVAYEKKLAFRHFEHLWQHPVKRLQS